MPRHKVIKPRRSHYDARISTSTWNQYLPMIRQLYLVENKSLADVMQVMEDLHGFKANAGQYYEIFKKRKIAKHLKGCQWLQIFEHLEENSLERHNNKILIEDREFCLQQIMNALRHHGKSYLGLVRSRVIEAKVGAISESTESGDKLGLRSSQDDCGSSSTYSRIQDRHQRRGTDLMRSAKSPLHIGRPSLEDFQPKPFYWQSFCDRIATNELFRTHPDLSSIVQSVSTPTDSSAASRLIPLRYATHLKALFWPSPDISQMSVHGMDTVIAKFLLSTLFNGTAGFEQIQLESIHQWIGLLTSSSFERLCRSFREEEMTILRDKILSAAIQQGDTYVVMQMLSLKPSFSEDLWMGQFGVPLRPIEGAIMKGHIDLAKAMVQWRFRGASPEGVARILDEIITAFKKENEYANNSNNPTYYIYRRHDCLRKELLCMPLNALCRDDSLAPRITVTPQTARIAMSDVQITVKLLKIQKNLVAEWIQACYLNDIVFNLARFDSSEASPTLRTILEWVSDGVRKMKIPRCSVEKVFPVGNQHPPKWVETELEAFWSRLGPCAEPATPVKKKPRVLSDPLLDEFREAVSEGNLVFVTKYLSSCDIYDVAVLQSVDYAAALGQDEVACELIKRLDSSEERALFALMIHNRLGAIVKMLEADDCWLSALRMARREHDYGKLYRWIFQHQRNNKPKLVYAEFYSRLVAYYAIERNDRELLEFALDTGALRAFVGHPESRHFEWLFTGSRGMRYAGDSPLPSSLIGVAGSRNRVDMFPLLMSHGCDIREPSTLGYAVRYGASLTTIIAILDITIEQTSSSLPSSFVANGQIAAIDQKNYDVLRIIVTRTGANVMDWMMDLTPLGKAILNLDIIAVAILLEHGANPNSLIAYDLDVDSKRSGTYLGRYTPVLAAIDLEDIEILRMLVEAKAFIENPSKYALLRSPLQRAAETGNFDATEYLLLKGAQVDYNDIFDSGTALQLAAIGGYNGIICLLIKHGADVNAMRSEGQGRTALEGAAEWGRPDTILLLLQHGVNLDLSVGNDEEPQAVRAMKYAREAGHGSLARYIDYLWKRQKAENEQANPATAGTELHANGAIGSETDVTAEASLDNLEQDDAELAPHCNNMDLSFEYFMANAPPPSPSIADWWYRLGPIS